MRNVIILGSGRSGTSMAAGCLATAGYHFGQNLVEARPTNPKGFYESRVINALNERILAPAIPPRNPDATNPTTTHIPLPRQYWLAALPPEITLASDESIQREITEHVSLTPFCYKDPRFCYTLPAWSPHLPDHTAHICIFRHPAATIVSTEKELAEQRYLATLTLSRQQIEAVWCAMYENVLTRLRHAGDWLFINYDQVLTPAGLDALAAFTNAPIDRTFPEAKLQRSQPDAPVSPRALDLYDRLNALAQT